ncbi:hypothetical protein [Pedobacter cryoconitis]|uniref:Uncharacterized protein n=1 Tax=Pedobacter cryoconitis TaxID=188932 RepID=A0A7X0J6S3_9SPHI|nr:hypothetical protein [Pedobacter cryoconitis]MBB6502146.1 hypothetical protein [Pedobacter cryoconitis]
MKYELQQFKSMVNALLQYDRLESWMKSQHNFIENIALETERICDTFKEISLRQEAIFLTDYFHYHQHALVVMIDQLHQFLTNLPEDANDEDEGRVVLQRLYNACVTILLLLHTQLKDFFKMEGKVPDSFIEQHQSQQGENHIFIEKSLLERSINATIVTHLIAVLRFEDQYPDDEISFSVYSYVLKVQKELLVYLHGKDDDTNNYQILKLLTTLNLNSIGIYEHYRGVVNEKQMPHFAIPGFQKPSDPIKMSLLLFIVTEINSLHALKHTTREFYTLNT